MFGLALRDTGLRLSDICALARAADDAGYEAIWLPEVGSRDAISIAAMLGGHTENIKIASGVVPVFSRNAVALALSVATASEACRGRFILGLGAGHRFTTEAWYQTSWNRPRHRMRETVDFLHSALTGERVHHFGDFKVDGFHLASDPPPVPIYFGALTPATLRLAGEVADGAILNWLPPDGLERGALLAREAAADAGRSITTVAYVRVAVAENDEQLDIATRAMREHTYTYASLPAYAASIRNAGLSGQLDALAQGDDTALDSLVDHLCCVGSPDVVHAKLERFRKCGVDQIAVYPVTYGDDPAASVLRAVRHLSHQ